MKHLIVAVTKESVMRSVTLYLICISSKRRRERLIEKYPIQINEIFDMDWVCYKFFVLTTLRRHTPLFLILQGLQRTGNRLRRASLPGKQVVDNRHHKQRRNGRHQYAREDYRTE